MLRGPWLHKGRSLFLMTSGAPQHSVAAGQVQRKFIRCVGVPSLTAPVWRVLRLKSKTTAEGFTCNRKSILLSSSQLVLIKENLGFSFCAKFYAKFARFFLHLCTFPPFLHVSVFERAAGSDLGSGRGCDQTHSWESEIGAFPLEPLHPAWPPESFIYAPELHVKQRAEVFLFLIFVQRYFCYCLYSLCLFSGNYLLISLFHLTASVSFP